MNKQRADKAIESVAYTLAHNLGGKANAVASGVTGDVKITRNGKFADLYGSDGVCLLPGDKIQTGADGKIDLVMKDGHKIHLEPHSTLAFEKDEVSFLAEGELAAMKKLITYKMRKKFEVRTPEAVCGVRGTEYSIQASPEGTTIEVHEGSVEACDLKKTQSVVVEAGFKVFVPKDGLPGAPEKDENWKTWIGTRPSPGNREDRMKRKPLFLMALWTLTLLTAQAAKIPAEAKKHLDYGTAALEMASDEAGYQKAAVEFEAAAQLAPKWPVPYFDLGVIYSKMNHFDDALRNYGTILGIITPSQGR